MLSNFAFVLLCFCSCNCQTFNQNDNTGKLNRNSEERTSGVGTQSNAKLVISRDQPYTYETNHGNNNNNRTFKPLAYPVPEIAPVTDVNASDNNFPKAEVPGDWVIPSGSNAKKVYPGRRASANVNNQRPQSSVTLNSANVNNQRPQSSVTLNSANVNNQRPQSSVPLNSANVNNQRPQSSFPVNSGNNEPQVYQRPINNNHQQNTVIKTTHIPAHIVVRSTISPSQNSNTGLNIQPIQRNNSKPASDVTTSNPKIFFPEEDKNLNRKPVNHNRQPVHSNVCDLENELLYPGDRAGDWACDCKPGYIYHPLTNKCWESHKKGPCSEGQLLALSKTSRVPECQRNDCAEDYVLFKNACHGLGSLIPCPQEHGPRPLMLIVDATTMELTCSDLHSVNCDLNDCCLGGKRPIGQNCIKE